MKRYQSTVENKITGGRGYTKAMFSNETLKEIAEAVYCRTGISSHPYINRQRSEYFSFGSATIGISSSTGS